MNSIARIASLLVVAASTSLTAQQQPSANPAIMAACGDLQLKFKASKGQPAQAATAAPLAGKASVYIFSVLNNTELPGCIVTSRVGVDGKWVGANCGSSWLSFSVDPGEHHLCAAIQAGLLTTLSTNPFSVSLASLNTEPGKTYYFRAKLLYLRGLLDIDLRPVDPDEARLLLSATAPSISSPRK